VNLDTGQAVELGRIPGIKPQPPYAPDSRRILRLSPDGKVLALLDLGESLFAEPSFRLIALGEQSLGESRTLALPGVRDMRFVPDNNTLEALTPTHIFTLPMSEWRKATPKTRPGADGPKPPIEFPPGPWRTQRGGADLRVPAGGAGDILFVAVRPEDDRGRPFWQMTAARVVYVPHDGKLLLGPDDKVFFIGPTGSVFRVELEKLASQPPPAAPRP
jgi:hypothetical protein